MNTVATVLMKWSRGEVPVDRRLLDKMADMLMTSQGTGVNERPSPRDNDVKTGR